MAVTTNFRTSPNTESVTNSTVRFKPSVLTTALPTQINGKKKKWVHLFLLQSFFPLILHEIKTLAVSIPLNKSFINLGLCILPLKARYIGYSALGQVCVIHRVRISLKLRLAVAYPPPKGNNILHRMKTSLYNWEHFTTFCAFFFGW